MTGILKPLRCHKDLLIGALLCVSPLEVVSAKLNDIELCSEVFAYNGLAYFCGNHARLGREVFRSNGTPSGTFVINDIDAGPGSSSPNSFFEFKGFMFFVAETTQSGWALWQTDGTSSGTKLIKELGVSADSYFEGLVNILDIGDELLLQLGGSLWRTNGTYAGTSLLDNAPVIGSFSSSLGFWPATTYVYESGMLYFMTLNRLYKMALADGKPTLIKPRKLS